MRVRIIAGWACAPLFALALWAGQGAAKRPITHDDYDGWNSILNPVLSDGGKHAAYGLFPQQGNGWVVVRELPRGKERREPAGALPPPPPPDIDGPPRTAPRGPRIAFTHSGRFVISTTFAPHAAEKKPGQSRGGLLILNLAGGAAARIADVRSVQVPRDGGDVIAYLKEAAPEPEQEKKPGTRAGAARYGTDLVLRQLATGAERTFSGVIEYALTKDGRTLVYAVSSRREEENGVFAVDTEAGGAAAALLQGKGAYARLAWDRGNTRLAFLSNAGGTRYRLYLWNRGSDLASEAAGAGACREGFFLSEHGTVSFSRDGSRVFAGCAPPRPERTAAPAEGRVVADLWHWKDDFVQPVQKARAARERTRTYTGVYDIAAGRFLQLASPHVRSVFPSDSGRYAIAADDHLYRRMTDYDDSYADYYLVDTATGAHTRAIEKLRGGYGAPGAWSPDGKYVLFFRDRHWNTISVPDGKVTALTSGLGVPFHREDDDRPEPPGSHGTAGWTSDSRHVLLYDRYDVWQVSPDGRSARNLTEGYGRRSRLQFRVVRLEDEEDATAGIDPERPLLLRAENLSTRDTGFFRDRLGADTEPRKLTLAARNFRTVAKARAADVILLTASRFDEFPDLQATDSSFAAMERISEANPQKAGLLWGTAELIGYRNADGVPLQAVLYRPENFDRAKKYPLMVYIYERLSQNLHNFVDPKPGHSINIAYYVSNGYLVLTPDIVYTVGAPGQSALKCVLPAIDAAVARGGVDENAIGIQGHSWGGYQAAYMIGHTTRFRAAEAGAPVGNMVSAYNGIRWGSGMPRQFQYEQTQSRIGGSLWEKPLAYVENSPIFAADRIRTPLLILHDDQDDAVPWYQGIELFLSLRRLGREAYLFNYNGERHGLRQRWNQKDYARRMEQFFDHFLKGAPAPEWMREGIPYLDREAEKARFSTERDSAAPSRVH